jgi:hypothetical protein
VSPRSINLAFECAGCGDFVARPEGCWPAGWMRLVIYGRKIPDDERSAKRLTSKIVCSPACGFAALEELAN